MICCKWLAILADLFGPNRTWSASHKCGAAEIFYNFLFFVLFFCVSSTAVSTVTDVQLSLQEELLLNTCWTPFEG